MERSLARRWAFLRPRLLRLPHESHRFEVDFCPLPDIVEDEYNFWLGLVVDPDLDLNQQSDSGPASGAFPKVIELDMVKAAVEVAS
jgi:hypothetical protein